MYVINFRVKQLNYCHFHRNTDTLPLCCCPHSKHSCLQALPQCTGMTFFYYWMIITRKKQRCAVAFWITGVCNMFETDHMIFVPIRRTCFASHTGSVRYGEAQTHARAHAREHAMPGIKLTFHLECQLAFSFICRVPFLSTKRKSVKK